MSSKKKLFAPLSRTNARDRVHAFKQIWETLPQPKIKLSPNEMSAWVNITFKLNRAFSHAARLKDIAINGFAYDFTTHTHGIPLTENGQRNFKFILEQLFIWQGIRDAIYNVLQEGRAFEEQSGEEKYWRKMEAKVIDAELSAKDAALAQMAFYHWTDNYAPRPGQPSAEEIAHEQIAGLLASQKRGRGELKKHIDRIPSDWINDNDALFQELLAAAWWADPEKRTPEAFRALFTECRSNTTGTSLPERHGEDSKAGLPLNEDVIPGPDLEDQILNKLELESLLKFIPSLANRTGAQMLLAHVEDGLSYEEIAVGRGISVQAVKNGIHRARKELQKKK